MQYEEIKIDDFFSEKVWHVEKMPKIEVREKIADINKQISEKEPEVLWDKIYNEIMANSSKLLDIKLKDVLENGWNKYQEVSKYLDKEKYSTDEMFLIPVVEHTIVSEHHPKIEISLGETHIADIDFEIMLKLFLTGIILKISNGKIEGIKAGKCKSSGTFSCEGVTLFEDESREFEF